MAENIRTYPAADRLAIDQHAAAERHGPLGVTPGVAAGEIDGHVDPASARDPRLAVDALDGIHHPFPGVVSNVIGTERRERAQLGGRAGAGQNFRSEELRDLHARDADAAAGAEDQDLLAADQPAPGYEHAVRRAVGERQAGGILERYLLRHGDELGGGHRDELGPAAVGRFPDHSGALAIPEHRVDQHPVTGLPGVRVGTDRHDFPGDVGPHDDRQRDPDPRHAAARENVVIVHRGGGNAQQHLVARRLRIGKVLVQLQAIPLAMFDCDDRSHLSRLPGGYRPIRLAQIRARKCWRATDGYRKRTSTSGP